MEKEKRILNLDLFRFIAIVIVVYFHMMQMFLSNKIISTIYSWGAFGVEFFFVLSGFLIGGLFYKNPNGNLIRFWLLRFCRTYPPYVVALGISFLTVYIFRNERFDLLYLIFLQNFFKSFPYFKISWSLCVEEHFYLIFPLMMLSISKLKLSTKAEQVLWMITIILPTIFRFCFGKISHDFGYFNTASYFRFDGIAMGAFLAFLTYRRKIKIRFSLLLRRGIYLLCAVAIALNIYLKYHFVVYCCGYFFLSLCLCLLLSIFYTTHQFSIARFKIVSHIAGMAYSIYLTHAVVINFVANLYAKFHLNLYATIVAGFLFIYVAGLCFFLLIEKPTIRLRNKYLHSPSPAKA